MYRLRSSTRRKSLLPLSVAGVTGPQRSPCPNSSLSYARYSALTGKGSRRCFPVRQLLQTWWTCSICGSPRTIPSHSSVVALRRQANRSPIVELADIEPVRRARHPGQQASPLVPDAKTNQDDFQPARPPRFLEAGALSRLVFYDCA